jgi:hypothetical protein
MHALPTPMHFVRAARRTQGPGVHWRSALATGMRRLESGFDK